MTGSAAPRWRKSTFSDETNCVEVSELPDGSIGIRNSSDPGQPPTVFSRADIAAFFRGVKAGEFDDLM
jgi:hypothetical protein